MRAEIITYAYLLVLCGALPALAWISKRKLDAGLRVPRAALYIETVLVQLLLLAISAGVAAVLGIQMLGRPPGPTDALLGLALLGVAVASMAIGWRFADAESRQRVLMLIPHTRNERRAWIGVSSAAGIAEELTYRAVLPFLLFGLTGSLWLSFLLSAAAFAFAHL